MTSDLRLIKEFGEQLSPATAEPPPELRERVLAAAPTRPNRGPTRLAVIRLAPVAAALTSTAAVVLAMAALVVPTVAGDTAQPAVVSTADAPPAPTAADVLRLAATRLANTPETPVRAGQFRYTESVGVNQNVFGQGWQLRDGETLIREWWSADGNQGQVLERPLDTPDATWRPASAPGCEVALPADADAMYAYLTRPAAEGAWQRAMIVLVPGCHPTAVRVAVLNALARLPGLTMRLGARVAIGYPGLETQVIIDANTHDYLGTDTIAIRQRGVVDNLGDVPN